MPEMLNPGGEPSVQPNPQAFFEAVMSMAEDMREIADFCQAMDQVLSREEFQTGPKQVRITPQRFIDAYNEERGAIDEGDEPAGEAGPAP